MLNIGLIEWLLIFTIALLLIGPEQLPKVAQVIGQSLNELKRIVTSFKTDVINHEKSQTIRQLSSSNKEASHKENDKDHSLKTHKTSGKKRLV